MSQAVLGMTGMTPLERIAKARSIATGLTGNANYATPIPSIATINTAATDYESTYNNSRGRDANKMSLFRTQGKAFMAVMVLVLPYVQVASGGDAIKIESANLSVKKTGGPAGALAKVTGLSGKQGANEGESNLTWDALSGKKSYIGERSDDNITWVDAKCPCTSASVTVTGLVTETYSWFRIAGVNKFGRGPWSDPVRVEAK